MFVSGILVLCFVFADGINGLLKVMGLGNELYRSRVSGDLILVRWLTIIVGGFFIAAPAVVWRYGDRAASFSRRIAAFIASAAQTPLFIPALLALLILLKTVLQLCLYLSGYYTYSADDFGRILVTEEWFHDENLGWKGWLRLGAPWLPFPNFLFGVALALYPDLYFTPKILNMLLSGTAVVVMYFLGCEIFGRTAGLLTAALFAFLPWHVWLGISGMTSDLPSAVMIALFGLLLFRWFATENLSALPAAGACLFVANGMRYETWCFSVVFALLMIGTIILRWRGVRLGLREVIFAASGLAIASAFPLVHVGASYIILGDFLPAMRKTDSFKIVAETVISKINIPLLALISFPFELLLSIVGIGLSITAKGLRSVRLYLGAVVTTLLLFGVLFRGSLPAHGAGVSRVLLPYIMLLLPFAGLLITRLLKNPVGSYHAILGCLLVLTVLAFGVIRASNYRDTFPKDAIYAGWLIRTLEETETIPYNSKILIEKNEGKHWGHFGVMVVANRAERFARLDRGVLKDACGNDLRAETCRNGIHEGNFKLAVLWSQERINQFKESFVSRSWQIGQYYIFEIQSSR
jgi:hypothetical protein